MTYRLSIQERIALTPGLRPSAMIVLQAVAHFADFDTGRNGYAKIDKLVAWTDLSRPTVARALRWLEDDGWLIGEHRHRRAAVYHVRVDRLATSAMRAKVVPVLSTTFETQNPQLTDLSAKNETQTLPKTNAFESQNFPFESQNFPFESQKLIPPCISTPTLYPQAPPLRVGEPGTAEHDDDDDGTIPTRPIGESPESYDDEPTTTVQPRTRDVSADRDSHPDLAAIVADGSGGDYCATLVARVRLQQRPDLASDRRGDGSPSTRVGPSAAPRQHTFGPMDVSAGRQLTQLGRMVDAFRAGLFPTGASPPAAVADARADDEPKEKSG